MYFPCGCYVIHFNPYSAGIDFRRQNLTFIDVIFLRLRNTIRVTQFMMAETHNIDIKMNQRELTKTFMMILNRKKNVWFPSFIRKYVISSRANPFYIICCSCLFHLVIVRLFSSNDISIVVHG